MPDARAIVKQMEAVRRTAGPITEEQAVGVLMLDSLPRSPERKSA